MIKLPLCPSRSNPKLGTIFLYPLHITFPLVLFIFNILLLINGKSNENPHNDSLNVRDL